MGAPRTPKEETPSPDAVVVRPGAETGDSFSYEGRAIVHVAAPQPVTTPPVSGD
jgi:hypothetical protein